MVAMYYNDVTKFLDVTRNPYIMCFYEYGVREERGGGQEGK